MALDNNKTIEGLPCVLVVEDEALIRLLAVDAIEDAGFPALGAHDAEQAVDILKTHKEVCVLFTDVNMPGRMNGVDFARYVNWRWPRIKIVVTTGRLAVGFADLPGGCDLMRKPYSIDRLIEKLKTAHDGDCAGRSEGLPR